MKEQRWYYLSEQAPPCSFGLQERTDHCWHTSDVQHPEHIDRVCCFCGVLKCFDVRVTRDLNHGPFAPERIAKIVE